MTLLKCLLIPIIILFGCKQSPLSGTNEDKSNGSDNGIKNRSNKFRVAVIDDGFDETLDVFKGKLIASYTLRCTEDKEEGIERRNLPYEELKRKVLEGMGSGESECNLEKNIDFKKSSRFSEIRRYREPWNRFYLEKQHIGDSVPKLPDSTKLPSNSGYFEDNYPATGDTSSTTSENPNFKLIQEVNISEEKVKHIYNILDGEGIYNYHGTNVASLIAYNNPNVELVFIQKELAKNEEDSLNKLDCFTPEQLSKLTRLFRDPDIVRAYVNAPLDPGLSKMDRVLSDLNIDFINTSFGTPPTKVLERLFEKKGCGKTSFSEFNRAMNDLEQVRETTIRKKGLLKSKALTISAFGNDSLGLNSNADGEECAKVFTINVASTDSSGKVAGFSNHGKCADVFLPGVGLIVAAPENFLKDTSGTSFSSPLFVRFLTQSGKSSTDYSDIYKRYKGSQYSISSNQIPNELLLGSQQRIGAFSLIGEVIQLPRKKFDKIRLPFGLR